MANLYNYNPNQNMINQLLRQKDNIDNMINQYSQPQQPIQNIINTGMPPSFEARILNDDEEIDSVFINHRTMFLDKKNKKVVVRETDGKISEEYEIILPLDEKDKKIQELENKLKEMEEKIYEYSKPIKSDDEQFQSDKNGHGNAKSSAKASGKSI